MQARLAGRRSAPHRAAGEGARLAAGSASQAPTGTARIVRYRNTEILVTVDAPAGGILVLNDVWHPWWRARIDGSKTELLRANVLFRGVVVPAGRHVVRFTFHPFAGAWKEVAEKIRARALRMTLHRPDENRGTPCRGR